MEEWVAKVFLRPIAFRIVTLLYGTKIHPVHVTVSFLFVGVTAAYLITRNGYFSLFLSALLIQAKSILDAVDGQLARARNSPSRVGRFFDSAADFVVGFLLVLAVSLFLYRRTGDAGIFHTGLVVFLLSGVQNSFWVYYNVAYRNLKAGIRGSILDESSDSVIYPYDEGKEGILQFLRGFYRVAYVWQDRLIALIDSLSRKAAGVRQEDHHLWYGNVRFLRASGILALGTNLLALSISLVLSEPSYYFVFVLYFADGCLVLLVLFHILSHMIGRRREGGTGSSIDTDNSET